MIDASRFHDIMEDLRKLPENSDRITAYGCPEEYEGIDALGDFFEAICEDENFKLLNDDFANSFFQLYSIDFQSKHEGICTFYENFYGSNKKDDVLRACKWLDRNGFTTMAKVVSEGYEGVSKHKIASSWIDSNAAEIYNAYRKIMFEFEAYYFEGK